MDTNDLIKLLPSGYEQACFDKKAITRKRTIKNPLDLLRLILFYLSGNEDTEHLHLHFILNSVNMLTGYKWHMNSAEFREFKNNMEKYADDYLKKEGHSEPYGDFEDVAISELF